MNIFLGGRCNQSEWKEPLLDLLVLKGVQPIMEDWPPLRAKADLVDKDNCDIYLYVITPRMTSLYAIAELVEDSNKNPGNTVLLCLRDDGYHRFPNNYWESLQAISTLVEEKGVAVFKDMGSCAEYISGLNKK